MPNQVLALVLSASNPTLAHTAGTAGQLTFYYVFYVIPIVLLLHLIAMIYFQKRERYRSKRFMNKHLSMVMLFLLLGVALTTFEYLMNLSKSGMHIGTFLSILFVYGFVSFIFAIPYVLHLTTSSKTP
ncbi:hypothetical protein [Psychrobacter jeotgali]|uniref:hypothetical protein n=1 Tax=Psychrobacter jeotgali TaxID=179010 RepID=UPI0019193D77|nr:hypothetical protein [Psychrobacter jeotgali]